MKNHSQSHGCSSSSFFLFQFPPSPPGHFARSQEEKVQLIKTNVTATVSAVCAACNQHTGLTCSGATPPNQPWSRPIRPASVVLVTLVFWDPLAGLGPLSSCQPHLLMMSRPSRQTHKRRRSRAKLDQTLTSSPSLDQPPPNPPPPGGLLGSLTCVRGIEAGPAGFRGSEWGCLAAAAAPACCQITDPSWRLELVLRCPPELQIPWVETHGGGS